MIDPLVGWALLTVLILILIIWTRLATANRHHSKRNLYLKKYEKDKK